nr:protein ELYS [Parasteatoda tepidariorum]
MYSMAFHQREYVKAFGALYTELQVCSKRFELPFTNDVYHNSLINPSMNSRLLSCQVVSQKDLSHSHENISGNESCEAAEEMSLCFITWEVWNQIGSYPSSYHFAVFDLNQWYQAQMPCSFRCDPSSLSPYIGIFSLEETKRVLGKKELLGVFTVPQSIKKFKSLQVSEEFFYPSSLGFQTLSFSHHGLCKTTYFGFQKHLLFEMADLGPKVLISPKEVFSSLVKCGLVSDTHGGIDKTPLVSQRESILQLALEYHLPFFFIKCLKEWRYSDSVHEFCTSKGLLNWGWKKVLVIKNSIDRLCGTLFNCSGIDVDKRALKSLYAYRRQFYLIDNIISGYQRHVTPRTEQGIQDLHCRREALSCINLYLQVLLWLRSVHVLPEVNEDNATSSNVIYRFDEINKSYSCRRSALQALNSTIGATDVLMIDGIVKEVGVSGIWQEKNGTGIYPPPSIYAALNTYLLHGVDTNWKHAIIYYLLLDLKSSAENTQFEAEVKKFPVIFNMPKSIVKLVKAFWYLDRKDCNDAIRKIFDPAVKSSDILMWHHHRIIKSCLYYRNPEKALKYINHVTPPQNTIEDMRLYLSVLLACGAITQAFEYQRKKQNQGYGNDLMKHLFLGCQEMGKMRELMYLPLNNLESSTLVQFLSESESAREQETLVIYQLLHCKLFEAEKNNEKLSLLLMKKSHSPSEALIRERSADRNALVECLLAGVSKTERNLVNEINRLPLEAPKREEYIQPLSVSVRSKTMRTESYSDFLRSLITKMPSSEHPKTPRSGSAFENLPFLRPVNTPERSVKNTPAVRNICLAVNKRSLMSTSPNEYATPAKRSRLLDNATFMETPLSKRKAPRHLAGDIASLLQTPPIHRRVSLTKSNPGTPIVKPQSILKKSTAAVMETDADFHRAETPPILILEENLEEVMQVEEKGSEQLEAESESQSKQIRFDLPLADQSVVSENVSIISEVAAADESFESSLCSSPEKLETSWKNSMTNLAREPLSKILKHSPAISMCRGDVKDNISTSEGILYEPKEPSSLRYSKAEGSDLADGTVTSSNTLFSGSGIESSPNFVKECDSYVKEFSKEAVNQDFGTPASQRKNISVRPPLRKETSLLETEASNQNIMWEQKDDTLNIQERSTSLPDKSPNQSSATAFLADNTIVAEDSDNEIFYSPCSSISSPGSILLDEKTQNLSSASFVSSKNALEEKKPEKSRHTFIFSRSGSDVTKTSAIDSDNENVKMKLFPSDMSGNTSTHALTSTSLSNTSSIHKTFIATSNTSGVIGTKSKESSSESFNLYGSVNPMPFKCPESFKPSRKTFIFSRSKPETSTTITDTTVNVPPENNPNNVLPENSAMEKSTSNDKADDLNIQKSRNTFVFAKPKSDDLVSDDQDIALKEQNPSGTFVFAKPKYLSNEGDQHIDSNKHNSSKSFVFSPPDSSLTVPSFSLSNQTFQINKPKASRKTYVFTRSKSSTSSKADVTATDTLSTQNTEIQPKVFDSFLQPEPLNKPSRRTFVFTRTSTRTSTSVTDSIMSDTVLKDTLTVESKDKKAFPAEDGAKINKTFLSSQSSSKTGELPSATYGEKSITVSKPGVQSKSEVDMEIEVLSPTSSGVDFLQASAAETYEEFSSTLSKNTPYKSSKNENAKIVSSPCAPTEMVSNAPSEAPQTELTEERNKPFLTSAKKEANVTLTSSATKSKKKKKGKIARKIEFSFAEPHSPATPEVLEALSQTPEQPRPLPSFMFSPPLTRGRLRQKTLDETMGSSFSSVISETSFSTSVRKPPMDPILEGIMQEKTLQTKTKRSTKKQAVKGSSRKKTSIVGNFRESSPDAANQSQLLLDDSTASTSSVRNSSARHSMVLRQMRSKKADISFL